MIPPFEQFGVVLLVRSIINSAAIKIKHAAVYLLPSHGAFFIVYCLRVGVFQRFDGGVAQIYQILLRLLADAGYFSQFAHEITWPFENKSIAENAAYSNTVMLFFWRNYCIINLYDFQNERMFL